MKARVFLRASFVNVLTPLGVAENIAAEFYLKFVVRAEPPSTETSLRIRFY